MLVTGIELWKLCFQIRAHCALMSAFDKIAGTKKNCRQTLFFAVKRFFFSQTLFFAVKRFFFAGKRFFLCRQRFSLKKIANDENLSSYLSQGDGSLKKNNPYLIKLVRE
jgi:hypothetical protein